MRLLVVLSFSLIFQSSLFGQSLFTKIAPDQSNIYFNNKLEDTREHNILLYSNYYGGAGVAIGDLNNDGLQDIFFAGNLVEDKLYQNLGDFKFNDISDEAGIEQNGAWSTSVLIADINNDGLKDIYVTCELYDDKPELRKNKLYINKGNMQFVNEAEKYGLDNSERSRGATFIDYDKDGWLDLFLLNQPPNPGNYSPFSGQQLLREEWSPRLFKNLTGQRFVDISMKAGVLKPCYANAVIAADFDKDGWQDLYVSNDYEAPDFLYHNNGDGTFTNIIDNAMQHISYYSMGVDAADINNDGLSEIMTLDMVAEDNFRLKSNMGSMKPELFWKLVKQGAHYQYMFNNLHWNRGNNVYTDIAQLSGVSSTDWSWSNLIADFDNDGWKDIYITNGLLRDIRNTDMSKKFPEFVKETISDFLANNPNAGEVHILDILDLQKGLDLHPSVPLNNYAYKNMGNLSFDKVSKDWGLDLPSFSNGSAYGDLDNDGDLDLVVNNINEPAFLFENKASLSNNFIRIQLFPDSKKSSQGIKVQIKINENVQYAEVSNARGMYSSSEEIIHFGIGKATTVDEIEIIWPNGEIEVLEEVSANQTLKLKQEGNLNQSRPTSEKPQIFKTISASSLGLHFEHQENIFDDYKKQILLPHQMSQHGPAMAVGDINGDQLEDIFIGGASGQLGLLYQQKPNGQFEQGQSLPATDKVYEDIDAQFFDADQDGDLDLYIVSGGNAFASRNKNYLDRLYLNDGDGHFHKEESLPRILESGSCVRPIDFDQDGDLDLFIGGRHNPWDYPSPAISRLLENQEGQFVDVTKTKAKDLIFIGMVTDAKPTDFDEDGHMDLILIGEWMSITFLKNTGSGFEKFNPRILENGKTISTTGWWQQVAVTDIDQDGDDDYILGNLGTNYKYKASQTEPFEVHYGDFDGNKKKDIILSYYNFGEQFPLRGRSCSSAQIPELKTSFPSYDVFASASLEEVYQPSALSKALNYKAHTFKSGILINNDNEFEFVPFQNEIQTSNINSFLIDDFNADGAQEIVSAGNMYQSEIETPRNDGSIGTFLSKNSNGIWRFKPAVSTGLYLPYDVKHLLKININGKPHILVGINNQAPIFLKY